MTWQSWVINLTWAMSNTGAIFVFCTLLDVKYDKRLVKPAFVAGTTFVHILRTSCYIYFPAVPSDELFALVFLPAYFYLFLRFTCRDKSVMIVMYAVLVFALGLLCHILVPVGYYLFFGKSFDLDFVGYDSLYASLASSIITTAVYMFCAFSWRRYSGKIRASIPNAGVLLLVLGGQLVYGISQFFMVMTYEMTFSIWSIIGIIIMIIANLAFIQIMITNSMKSELETHLREIQHIRELEQVHYTAVEARRQEMAKIRHDFYNQLTAAHQLITSNKSEHAERFLMELEYSLDGTKEQMYCNNAIINAVLIEKQKECDCAGIVLEPSIKIGEECGITSLHLCSIFTNLLDNAIRACSNLPQERRRIEIRAAVKGDYLHIKCVNPVAVHPGEERGGSGYGKTILSDIAGQYGGYFNAVVTDETHVAVVSLLFAFSSDFGYHDDHNPGVPVTSNSP